MEQEIKQAAEAIRSATALLIGAGAGMGVDSGLPDFRGPEGFWKAYPPFRGRAFAEMSTPHWFRTDPALAWGFFGHRLGLYRSAIPHIGFKILKKWIERMPTGGFVFTSNVDGQFQKAGFAETQVIERHGSIHYLQCFRKCRPVIWSADEVQVDVDLTTIRATSTLPQCPHCHGIARPNILMFGDWDWDSRRCEEQNRRYLEWVSQVRTGKLVTIELGAGLAVPTVRQECESLGDMLIRINPREPQVPLRGDGTAIGIAGGAADVLSRIDALL